MEINTEIPKITLAELDDILVLIANKGHYSYGTNSNILVNWLEEHRKKRISYTEAEYALEYYFKRGAMYRVQHEFYRAHELGNWEIADENPHSHRLSNVRVEGRL